VGKWEGFSEKLEKEGKGGLILFALLRKRKKLFIKNAGRGGKGSQLGHGNRKGE